MDKDWSIREITTAPIITDELTWSRDYTRHLIGNIKEVNRDRIFRDAFLKMGCLEDREIDEAGFIEKIYAGWLAKL